MKRFSTLFLLVTLILFAISCSSNWTKTLGSYGQDSEITKMFETHEYVSDYHYFYTGDAKAPEAILGIEKDFDLVKVSGWANVTNWQKFEPGGEKLKELVDAMRNQGRPYGFFINAPGEEQVGVMYTTKWGFRYTPFIRLKDENQLEVTPHKYNSSWAPS
jgi:hypothetical protein